jgi:hypothetical protein
MARLIEAAARLNGDLQSAIRETGTDTDFYTTRERAYDEFLPWQIIDNGLSQEFLQKEHERAHIARSTPPCPSVTECTRCGVCPSTWLGNASSTLVQLQASTATSQVRLAFQG